MSLYPLFYILTVSAGWVMSILGGPIYGLLTYVFVYFNIPERQWWGSQVPDLRWSLGSAAILLVSCFLHQDQLSDVRLSRSRPFQFLFAFLLLMALIVPFAVSPTALNRLYEFFRLVVAYAFVVKVIASHRQLRYFFYVFLIELSYLGYLALHYFRGGRLDGVGTADSGEANTFASLLIMGIPPLLYFLMQGKLYEKILALPVLAMVVNAFVMCRSRGGFLALVVTWVTLLIGANAKYRKPIFAASAAMGLIFFILIDPHFLLRLESLREPVEHSSGRWEIWQYGLRMLRDHPLGTGGEGFFYLSPLYMPERLINREVGGRVAHNTYLQVAVEQGVIGLLLFGGFLIATYKGFRAAGRTVGASDDLDLRLFSKLLLGTYSGILLACLFIDRLYSEPMYWMLALSVVSHHLIRKESISDKSSPDFNGEREGVATL